MKSHVDPSGLHVLRLDRGESLRAEVERYAASAGIVGAKVDAVGALEEPELGYYSLAKRRYAKKTLGGIWELAPLAGNITLLDGKPFLHAHVTLGGPKFRARVGHLFDAKVGVTVELFLTPLTTPLPRIPCETIGLPHWEPGA